MGKFKLIFLFCFASLAYAENGLINVKNSHNVATTFDRLESLLREKVMTVFARIDHAADAKKVEKVLRPTQLLVFGNPKVGTPLMMCSQSVGIDLPQKALIWEDAQGQVWLTYNDPNDLAARHNLTECGGVIEKVSKALSNFANAAATQ